TQISDCTTGRGEVGITEGSGLAARAAGIPLREPGQEHGEDGCCRGEYGETQRESITQLGVTFEMPHREVVPWLVGGAQCVEDLGEATLPGLVLLRVRDRAGVLLAFGERQRVERRAQARFG